MNVAEKMNAYLISQGQKILEHIEEMSFNPMHYQEALLFEWLEKNKNTEQGKKYDFENIHSIAEYQEKVPVMSYQDYRDIFMRMSEKGERNLITTEPIIHYNKSSGTTGTPKRIPTTEQALQQYVHYNGGISKYLMAQKHGMEWTKYRVYATTGLIKQLQTLPDGLTFGALSEKLSVPNPQIHDLTKTAPIELAELKKGEDERYVQTRFALMDSELSSIMAAFYSVMLEHFRYIEKNWEMLVEDIADGKINEDVKLSALTREKLMKKIKPMPERAKVLRNVFEQGFDQPFAKKIWKNLVLTDAIGTADFKYSYDTMMKRYIGEEVDTYFMGIQASEGVFAVPIELNNPNAICLPDSCFMEFLPVDADDDFSKIVTMDQLEVDKVYELIISNTAGLCRYRMRDAVKVTQMHNNTPCIIFMHRLDQTINLMGEKTTVTALRDALTTTAEKLDFEYVDFSVYPNKEAYPPHYTYLVEIAKKSDNLTKATIRDELETQLAFANPSMGNKVKSRLCGKTELVFLQPETYLLYKDLMVYKGVSSSQLKPVHVIKNKAQQAFFFGLIE